MKTVSVFVVFLSASVLVPALVLREVSAQAPAAAPAAPPAPVVPLANVRTPAIAGVVESGTRVEVLPMGDHALEPQSTEGPVAAPDGGLFFTEPMANRISKVDKRGRITTYLEHTNGTNALAIDGKGRLIGVDRGTPQLAVLAPMPSVLADQCAGLPFSRLNDLVVDKKGGIYFSDPSRAPLAGQTAPRQPTVYYLKPTGEVAIATQDVATPNGVQLSRDEKTLYVADTGGEFVVAFDVQADGSLGGKRNFAKLAGGVRTETNRGSGADGLAVDLVGRLYVVTTLGVQVFGGGGDALGTIPLPGDGQNLAFSGSGKKTLYVVGHGQVYAISMLTPGFSGRAK